MSDPETRIIKLKRRQKKQFVRVAEELVAAITIQSFIGFEIWLQRAPGYSWSSNTGDYIAGIANQ